MSVDLAGQASSVSILGFVSSLINATSCTSPCAWRVRNKLRYDRHPRATQVSMQLGPHLVRDRRQERPQRLRVALERLVNYRSRQPSCVAPVNGHFSERLRTRERLGHDRGGLRLQGLNPLCEQVDRRTVKCSEPLGSIIARATHRGHPEIAHKVEDRWTDHGNHCNRTRFLDPILGRPRAPCQYEGDSGGARRAECAKTGRHCSDCTPRNGTPSVARKAERQTDSTGGANDDAGGEREHIRNRSDLHA